MIDTMEQMTSNLLKKIEADKKGFLIKRIKELVGLDFDFELEKKKRFKSIVVEHSVELGQEKWYYNDGSEYGVLVMTCEWDQFNPLEFNGEFKLNYRIY